MNDEASRSASPTPEQVLSALDKTGFIFEYRTSQRLREFNFDVSLNAAYIDPESGKTREIDIVATCYRNIRSKGETLLLIEGKLIVECKNYIDPLVVIGRGDDFRFHNDQPFITFDPLQFDFLERDPENYGGIRMELNIGALPSNTTSGFIGSQLVKMRRQSGQWQATNDSVYDSIIYPLAKATTNEIRAEQDDRDSDPDWQPWTLPAFIYTFPVLVTAGVIYAVDVVPNEVPAVREVEWIPLVRQFDGPSFFMDIVSFSHISKYLQERVIPLLEQTNKVLRPNMGLFDPTVLLQRYGESQDPLFRFWLDDFQSRSQGT